MTYEYNGITYYVGYPIPQDVPLTRHYAIINGLLQYSNYFMRIFNFNDSDDSDDDIEDVD